MKNDWRITFTTTTAEEAHLPAYDATKLVAMNTCPTYGIIRHQMHKENAAAARSMALEAGAACHEFFAAMRVYNLAFIQNEHELAANTALSLFGAERYDVMRAHLTTEYDQTAGMNFALEALYTSGFEDIPDDKIRTMRALEQACIVYARVWDKSHPIWISPDRSRVGIEVPFDIVITFYDTHDVLQKQWRFIGRIDGIHLHARNNYLMIQENKTAGRLNEAWQEAFKMSHQVTGYMLAAQVFTGEKCNHAEVLGLKLPQSGIYDNGGYVREPVTRNTAQVINWLRWFYHSASMYDTYMNNPFEAPKYAHSCNRYFRPCSMIPFCVSEYEEQKEMINEFVHNEWSPLHGAHNGQSGD